jgi:hypothetical protein
VRTKLASGEMAVAGDQWPMLVYANLQYDPEDPWSGLFRNQILVYVSAISAMAITGLYCSLGDSKAFKHIFTSPSSVEIEIKATRSGNARIHGMTAVTTASISYVATQVRPLPQPYYPIIDCP